MLYSSKVLAGLLSAGIALATALILLFVESFTAERVAIVFLVSFVAGYLVLFLAFEFLIFQEVRTIKKRIHKAAGKEGTVTNQEKLPGENPLKTIRNAIETLTSEKNKEIDALKKRDAFRKDLIADISHELKTPIFAAQGFVHTLIDGAVKEKAVRKKFLKKAAKSLDGLDLLVQDLLTLSQIETGQVKMRFAEFDLAALVEEVFDQFKGKSNKKEVLLRMDGPARKILVNADRRRISQVITNFISNAIKHSPEAGEVVVRFGVRKKSVEVQIRDFGEGIPSEHIDRIFERFYRVDKSRSREKGGTGLGLAIVKHILEGHNTQPEVESTPGKGSTFSFRLPRARNENIENGEQQEPGMD